jgi:hypothetical protein
MAPGPDRHSRHAPTHNAKITPGNRGGQHNHGQMRHSGPAPSPPTDGEHRPLHPRHRTESGPGPQTGKTRLATPATIAGTAPARNARAPQPRIGSKPSPAAPSFPSGRRPSRFRPARVGRKRTRITQPANIGRETACVPHSGYDHHGRAPPDNGPAPARVGHPTPVCPSALNSANRALESRASTTRPRSTRHRSRLHLGADTEAFDPAALERHWDRLLDRALPRGCGRPPVRPATDSARRPGGRSLEQGAGPASAGVAVRLWGIRAYEKRVIGVRPSGGGG